MKSPRAYKSRSYRLRLAATVRERAGSHARRGLTVYEVFLALTILLGSLAVLAQHLSVGSRAGVRARLKTQAALYAETLMAEVVAGVHPLAAVSNSAVEGAARGWNWSLQVAAGPAGSTGDSDLVTLTLTVTHAGQNGQPDASFTLHRLSRDPQAMIEAADAAAANTEASEGTNSGTSGSSSPNSGGSK